MSLRTKSHLRRLWELTHGQDLIEYALLIALISTTVLVTLAQLGERVPAMYTTTADALPGEGDSPGDGNPGRGGNPDNGNPGNSKPVGNLGSNPGGGRGK